MIPSGPAPVSVRPSTSPEDGSRRTTSSPRNDVTQIASYAATARSGTPPTSTTRSGSDAPDGNRLTVSDWALTTQTAPFPSTVSPTGPVPTVISSTPSGRSPVGTASATGSSSGPETSDSLVPPQADRHASALSRTRAMRAVMAGA
jgi:hypothetical protein